MKSRFVACRGPLARLRAVSLLAAFSILPFLPVEEAAAQDKPRFEAHGGYSILRVKLPRTIEGEDTEIIQSLLGSTLGWNGGITFNVTRNFGVTGDVSGYYRKFEGALEGETGSASIDLHTFMGGPRVSGANGIFRPFAHALFGFANLGGSAGFSGETASFDNRGFAMAFGGGVDVVVHDKIALRPIQFDFFPVRQQNDEINSGRSITLKNLRFGTGIVFYLGRN